MGTWLEYGKRTLAGTAYRAGRARFRRFGALEEGRERVGILIHGVGYDGVLEWVVKVKRQSLRLDICCGLRRKCGRIWHVVIFFYIT